MAPYLNVRCDYFRHPKTQRLIGLLGRGAEVLPLRLWAFCGEFFAKDGELTGYTEQEIEQVADWWGEKGKMLVALERVGYARKVGEGTWAMTDWAEHQGHIEALKVRARLGAARRWELYRQGKAGNADGYAKAEREQSPIQQSRLQANGPKGRVKRGEDKTERELSVLDLKDIIAEKQKQADELEAKYRHNEGLTDRWTDENARKRWLELRRSIKAVSNTLAAKA